MYEEAPMILLIVEASRRSDRHIVRVLDHENNLGET
jgi:hypothetical protein